MRALLEHSRQTYGPLSAELRRIRSRTSSRPSPYPQPQRAIKISLSPSVVRPEVHTLAAPKLAPAPVLSVNPPPTLASQPLQERIILKNTVSATTDASSLAPGKNAKNDSRPLSQSRFSSNARRNTPGFTKRGIGKENQERDLSSGIMTACVSFIISCSLLTIMYRPNESLRLNRPRPRGRPAHARAALPLRI
jgi:serine/arginine repetitive matrix protein 2